MFKNVISKLLKKFLAENSALNEKLNEVKIKNRFDPWKFPAKIRNFPVSRLPYYPLSAGLACRLIVFSGEGLQDFRRRVLTYAKP